MIVLVVYLHNSSTIQNSVRSVWCTSNKMFTYRVFFFNCIQIELKFMGSTGGLHLTFSYIKE